MAFCSTGEFYFSRDGEIQAVINVALLLGPYSGKESIFLPWSSCNIGNCRKYRGKTLKERPSWSWQKWKPFLLATCSIKPSLQKAWNVCYALSPAWLRGFHQAKQLKLCIRDRFPGSVVAMVLWTIPSHLLPCSTFPASTAGLVAVREQNRLGSRLLLCWVFGPSPKGFVWLWWTF